MTVAPVWITGRKTSPYLCPLVTRGEAVPALVFEGAIIRRGFRESGL
ncbi:hypothetical protein [Streptomyces sp. NBC_01408]|nr:hypothetical protein [Streptomyces sp. NBC_01408]MCX4692486.1 hypothetical protein [Streptomyces sp. NBC_01408]